MPEAVVLSRHSLTLSLNPTAVQELAFGARIAIMEGSGTRITGVGTTRSEWAMSDPEMNPFEEVLRHCAQAAPQPWSPRVFARQKDVSKEDLSETIEHLLLDGL